MDGLEIFRYLIDFQKHYLNTAIFHTAVKMKFFRLKN